MLKAKLKSALPSRVKAKLDDVTCVHIRARIAPFVREWSRKRRQLAARHGEALAAEMADLWIMVSTAKLSRCSECWKKNQVLIPKQKFLVKFG